MSQSTLIPYSHTSCCLSTRRIDDLFSRFRHEKEQILTSLLSSPETLVDTLWKEKSPLSIDRNCLWGSKKFAFPLTTGLRKSYSCPQCRNLDRLVDLQSYSEGQPFLIETGSDVGKSLTLSSTPLDLLALSSTENCLQCDNFTNHILQSWLLEHLISFTPRHLVTAFVCADRNCLLQEFVYPIPKGRTHSLLQQLTAFLLEANSKSFFHGAPSPSVLSILDEPCSFVYRDVHISCPVTLKIDSFGHSCVTVVSNLEDQKRIQVYEKKTIPLRIRERISKVYRWPEEKEFKITQNLFDAYVYYLHFNKEFMSVIDAYLFFLSFVRNVGLEDVPEEWWNSLWKEDQIEEVTEEMEEGRELDEILKGKNVCMDVLERSWESLRK